MTKKVFSIRVILAFVFVLSLSAVNKPEKYVFFLNNSTVRSKSINVIPKYNLALISQCWYKGNEYSKGWLIQAWDLQDGKLVNYLSPEFNFEDELLAPVVGDNSNIIIFGKNIDFSFWGKGPSPSIQVHELPGFKNISNIEYRGYIGIAHPALSIDNKFVVVLASGRNNIRDIVVTDIATRQMNVLPVQSASSIDAMNIVNDGSRLALFRHENTTIKYRSAIEAYTDVVDLKSGNILRKIKFIFSESALNVDNMWWRSFRSPDGRFLVNYGRGLKINLIDMESPDPKSVLLDGYGSMTNCAFLDNNSFYCNDVIFEIASNKVIKKDMPGFPLSNNLYLDYNRNAPSWENISFTIISINNGGQTPLATILPIYKDQWVLYPSEDKFKSATPLFDASDNYSQYGRWVIYYKWAFHELQETSEFPLPTKGLLETILDADRLQ